MKISPRSNEILSIALVTLIKETGQPQTKNDTLNWILEDYAKRNNLLLTEK